VNSRRRRTHGLQQIPGSDGRHQVIVAAEVEHLLRQRLEGGVPEQEQAPLAAEFAQGAHRRLGAALHRLGRRQHRRVLFVGQFGDCVEQAGHAAHLRRRQRLHQHRIQLPIAVAHQKHALVR